MGSAHWNVLVGIAHLWEYINGTTVIQQCNVYFRKLSIFYVYLGQGVSFQNVCFNVPRPIWMGHFDVPLFLCFDVFWPLSGTVLD